MPPPPSFFSPTFPFSANFYAWVYVIIGLAYLVLFGSNLFLSFSVSETPPQRSFVSLLISPWTVVTAVLVASPGMLAGLYKANQDFSNQVNGLRASLNTAVESEWSLMQAYPGHVFEQPMYLAFEPERDDSFMVLSRPGRLFRYVTAPEWQEEVLLDLSEEVDSLDVEMGAYSFVLHPEFNQPGSENSGFAYVYYTHVSDGRHFNRLMRFDLSLPTQEEREDSRMTLIDLERLPSGMHNGGGIFFGPEDGFLYFSLGDFMMVDDTQQIDERLIAGIFRIDVDMQGGDVSTPIKRQPEGAVTQNYYIPTDNPWYGEENVLEEYWAHGFRNPWRMSMDPETGSIWLGDVGVNRYEEQNRVEKGDNGQWDFREGNMDTGKERPANVIGREIAPIYLYEQTALARAAMGGVVYRGEKYPELYGKYLFADNQAGTIHSLDPEDPEVTARVIAQAGQFGQLGITSLQAREDGEIFVTVLGNKERRTGEIVRLVLDDGATMVADASEAVSVDEDVDTKYVSVCSRCHGLDGKGAADSDFGEDAVERPDFTSAEWQERVTDDYLKRVIVEGGSAVGISEQMPAWDDFFNEEELKLLIKKLREFSNRSGDVS